jgi:hypothetical protein
VLIDWGNPRSVGVGLGLGLENNGRTIPSPFRSFWEVPLTLFFA